MHKFVRNLLTEWRKLGLPLAGHSAVVAVSGGADSTALILAVADLRERKKLDVNFITAHFNHGLRRRESDADEKFVREFSSDLGFECIVKRGKIIGRSNLEQRAREARYGFLHRVALKKDAGLILTAHTINDQAETLLMNLLRGSGVTGLSAMRPVRRFEGSGLDREVSLVRPLLTWARREDTEQFCTYRGVGFRVDAMNDDVSFTRVRVRKKLIPMLREFNPKIIETLARTAALVAEIEPDSDLAEAEWLHLKQLSTLPKSRLRQTIRSWLKANRGDLRRLELKHIEAVERLIESRKSGRVVELPGGQRVVKQNGRITLEKIMVEK